MASLTSYYRKALSVAKTLHCVSYKVLDNNGWVPKAKRQKSNRGPKGQPPTLLSFFKIVFDLVTFEGSGYTLPFDAEAILGVRPA